jgi:hypothetical protein
MRRWFYVGAVALVVVVLVLLPFLPDEGVGCPTGPDRIGTCVGRTFWSVWRLWTLIGGLAAALGLAAYAFLEELDDESPEAAG